MKNDSDIGLYLNDFNPEDIDTSSKFYDIPLDSYNLIVDSVTEKANKSNTGRVLNIKYIFIDGPFADKAITQSINYYHKSKTCQEIGQTELARLCEATSVTKEDLIKARSFDPFENKQVTMKASRYNNELNIYEMHPYKSPMQQQREATEKTDAPEDDIPF